MQRTDVYLPIFVRLGVERVSINRVVGTVRRLYVGTGGVLPSSLYNYVSYTRGSRASRLPGGVVNALLRGLSTTGRLGLPVYRSANVTMVFYSINRSIRVINNSFRGTMGRNISENCAGKLLHGSVIHSPLSEIGAGSGAPTMVRAEVIPNSGVGLAITPGNFNDRGVDELGVFAPSTSGSSLVSFILRAIGLTNKGPYPPVIVNMNFNKSFRCYTCLTGGTLYHPMDREGGVPICHRVRRRLLHHVGTAGVNPRNFNNGAATLTMGVRTTPARVTKLPTTIGVNYRMAQRTRGAV